MSQGKLKGQGGRVGSRGSLLGVHKTIAATDYPLLAWEPPAAAAAEQVPFKRPWLTAALAAWAVAPLLIAGPGINTPASAAYDQVPQKRAWAETARAQWEAPEPQIPRRRYAPQETAAVVAQNPFSRPWLEVARSSWDPVQQQFIRRLPERQRADSPPFVRNYAALQQWVPVDVSAVKRTFAPQENVVVESVPFLRRTGALAAWDRPPILVWQNGMLAQDGPPPAEAQPYTRPWLQNALGAWELAPYSTQRQRFYPQEPVVVVDQQPFTRPWLAAVSFWASDAPQFTPRKVYPQEYVAPPGDSPPYVRPWLKTAIASWDVAPIIVQQSGVAAQDGPTPDAHDSPPFSRRWLQEAISSWDVQLIPMWGPAGTPEEPHQPHVDREKRFAAVASWDVEFTIPTRTKRYPQEGVAPAEDVPNLDKEKRFAAVSAWPEPTWRQPDQRKYPQEYVAPPGDQPIGWRPWLKAALASWEPPEPEARQQPKRQIIDGPTPVTPDVSQSTPGRVLHVPRFYSEVESEEAKRKRRIREGTIQPPVDAAKEQKKQQIFDDSKRAQKQIAAIKAESAQLRAAIEKMEAELSAERVKIAKAARAKMEKDLLLAQQRLILIATQEAVLREELEVLDIAFIALVVLES